MCLAPSTFRTGVGCSSQCSLDFMYTLVCRATLPKPRFATGSGKRTNAEHTWPPTQPTPPKPPSVLALGRPATVQTAVAKALFSMPLNYPEHPALNWAYMFDCGRRDGVGEVRRQQVVPFVVTLGFEAWPLLAAAASTAAASARSWDVVEHHRPRLAFQKVSPLYQRNLPGGWFISEDPLHGGVRRS